MSSPTSRAFSFFVSLVLLNGCALFSDPTSSDTQVQDGDKKDTPKVTEVGSPLQPLVRKRVVILPFTNMTTLGGDELAQTATDYIRAKAAKYPELVVSPETEVENWRALQTEKQSPEFRAARDRALQMGISAFISGSIEQVVSQQKGDEVGLFRTHELLSGATLHFEIYDLSQSRPLFDRLTASEDREEITEFFVNRAENGFDIVRAKVEVEKALAKVMTDFGQYAKRIDWAGRIAKVDIDRYYINGGELTGITKGQLLKVFEDGQTVTDPQDASVIGVAPGRFKGFLRVIDLFGDDGAVAVIQSGGGFRERDRLRLVTSQK